MPFRATVVAVATLVFSMSGLSWAAEPSVRDSNENYKLLINQGVPWKKGPEVVQLKLPPPVLIEGMTEAEQQSALLKLIGDKDELEGILEKGVDAPFQMRKNVVGKFRGATPETTMAIHQVDVYFTAYGPLSVLGDRKFLKQQFNMKGSQDLAAAYPGKSEDLTAEQLQKRGIMLLVDSDSLHHAYPFTQFTILQDAQLSLTAKAIETNNQEMRLVASIIEPKFSIPSETEFPNQYRLARKVGNAWTLLVPQPYSVYGAYVQITQLQKPAGALFFEYHLLFEEPYPWFGGAPGRLFTNMNTVCESKIRDLRRDLKDAAAKK